MILWVGWVVPLIWAGLFGTGWSGMASLVDPEPQVTCRRTMGMVRASLFGTCHPEGTCPHGGKCFPPERASTVSNLLSSTCQRLPWWLRQWRIHQQRRRPRVNPWVGKIPWRRKWQPTPGYSCLENSMDRGTWQTTVHGVAKSQTRVS